MNWLVRSYLTVVKQTNLLDELRKQNIVSASTLMKEGVAEWSKAPNVKVRCRRNPTVGSNPTPSAKLVFTLQTLQAESRNDCGVSPVLLL
jgi:hypothetical protein